MAARLVRPLYARLQLPDGRRRTPAPPVAPNRDAPTPSILRDPHMGAGRQAPAPLPRAEDSDDRSIKVLRDDRMVVEEREREPLVQADTGTKASPAKPRKRRRDPDESLSDRTIVAIATAVVAMGFMFAVFLPSILTRPSADFTRTRSGAPAVRQLKIEPLSTTQRAQVAAPPPAPTVAAPPPAPAAPAPAVPAPAASVSNSASVAKSAPVASKEASAPTAKQAGNRARGAQALVPADGKAATTSRGALTAAEKAAVDRGLKELQKGTVTKAPPRPASNRFALTAEEQAAVERGLRELEKSAQQAKP